MKTKNRIKLAAPVIQTRAQMETLVGEIATAQFQLNKETSAMDIELAAVRARYEGKLDSLQTEIETKTQLAQVWADANPQEFGEHKSIEFVHGTVGFRTGTHKVVALKKSFTVQVILSLLEKFPWSKSYIRQKPEIDKEKIIADRKTLPEEKLATVGLKIVQDESFFIELKATETETRLSEKAA